MWWGLFKRNNSMFAALQPGGAMQCHCSPCNFYITLLCQGWENYLTHRPQWVAKFDRGQRGKKKKKMSVWSKINAFFVARVWYFENLLGISDVQPLIWRLCRVKKYFVFFSTRHLMSTFLLVDLLTFSWRNKGRKCFHFPHPRVLKYHWEPDNK